MAGKVADYDKDGMITSADKEYQSWDTNKDGKISPAEKKVATTGSPGETVATTKNGVTTTKTVGAKAAKKTPKSPSDFGFNKNVFQQFPDLLPLINKAIEEDWDDQMFQDQLDMSTFGQARTRSQESFDLAMADPRKALDIQKTVDDQFKQFKADAEARGITVSDAEIKNFAQETVRSGLTANDARLFFAGKFKMGTGTATGEAGVILADLQEMARSFGLNMDQTNLQAKVQEGLRQGSNYQVWLDGQKNVYRQQAKNLYPTIADQLDNFSYTDLIDPYMEDAANLLGLSRAQMNSMDPAWGVALNGPNGAMSRDEWIRTIKTDSRYGYDRTVNARQEATALGDELLATFGLA